MVHIKYNINIISNLFFIYTLFFHFQVISSSKIVIPFIHNNLNSDSFIQNNFENSIYSEIKYGTYNSYPSGKSIILFANLQQSILSIFNSKICPSNSFYNKSESTSYKYNNGLSQDSFYFYKDLELSKLEKFNNIVFKYQESNEPNNFCGTIGFEMISGKEEENKSFLYNLKKNNYIDNYFISFIFTEK